MTATAVEFDPFSAEYFEDPTEVYRRLRDEAPVYFSEKYGFYALSRFADVVAAHRDWRGFSSAHGVDLSTLTKDPELIRSLGMIIMMDPTGSAPWSAGCSHRGRSRPSSRWSAR